MKPIDGEEAFRKLGEKTHFNKILTSCRIAFF
jgi:hypothetical protein